MALSLRKTSDRGVVGLDIDGRYLAAAQVDGGRLVRGGQPGAARGRGGRRRGPRPAALSDALKRFAADEGLPKNVRLGVANQQIVVRVIELPRIEDEKQREAAVRFQAAEAIAMPLDEAVLDHQVAGFAEARRRHARACRSCSWPRAARWSSRCSRPSRAAGLKAEGVDLDAFALVRTLAPRRRRRRRVGPRLLPPRRRDQPGHRRRAHLLLHPPAVRGLGRRGRRLAARRRDPAVDRLLHDPAAGPARRRGRALRARVRRRVARREPRRPPRPPRPRGVAARRPRRVGLAPARTRTATRSRPASRWGRRHEARQPYPAGARAGAPPAARPGSSYVRARRARRAAPDGARLRGGREHRPPSRSNEAAQAEAEADAPRAAGRRAEPLRQLRPDQAAASRDRELAWRRRASTGSASCASSPGSCPSAAGSRPPTPRWPATPSSTAADRARPRATGAAVPDRQPGGLHAQAEGRRAAMMVRLGKLHRVTTSS